MKFSPAAVALTTVAASAALGCVGVSTSNQGSGATPGNPVGDAGNLNDANSGGLAPCDPLAPPPYTPSALLGAGKDTSGTLYVVEQPLPPSSNFRIFVSSGDTLYGKHVAGSGNTATDFTFSYQEPSAYFHPKADGSDLRTLLVHTENGVATQMALGGSNPKAFIGDPGAVSEMLTLVGVDAIANLKHVGLPGVIVYVADSTGTGNSIVITVPMDVYASTAWRLFYGLPGAMIERTITDAGQSMSGNANITFLVGPATFTAHFTVAFDPDAGQVQGPASLDVGDAGTLPLTLRIPTPETLGGFTFACMGR
jgi:hypothetical protein